MKHTITVVLIVLSTFQLSAQEEDLHMAFQTSIDLQSKESVKSERDSIFGYEDPCEPEDNINFGNNNYLDFSLFQNYPNPFNPITQIKYSLKEKSFVNLTVYDITGRKVAILINSEIEAGVHAVIFNSELLNLSSGIYFYRIKAASDGSDFEEVKRMVLLK